MTQAVSGCGGGRLSRQDPYHVPDHLSWQDLFYTLNQLNKVRHVWPEAILLSSGAGGGTGKGQASTLSTLSGRKTMSRTPNQPITDSMASWTTYMRKLIVL